MVLKKKMPKYRTLTACLNSQNFVAKRMKFMSIHAWSPLYNNYHSSRHFVNMLGTFGGVRD